MGLGFLRVLGGEGGVDFIPVGGSERQGFLDLGDSEVILGGGRRGGRGPRSSTR